MQQGIERQAKNIWFPAEVSPVLTSVFLQVQWIYFPKEQVLGLWFNELQQIIHSHIIIPPPRKVLEPQKWSASEWTKVSQWRSSVCKGRPFVSVHTNCDGEWVWRAANKFRYCTNFQGKTTTYLPSDQITVQLLPQTQLTRLLLLWWDQKGLRNYLRAIKIRGFLIILEDIIGNSRWRYVKLLFDLQEGKGSASLHDCSN